MIRNHPNIHRRKSIRLKGYDYSQPGLYFITICCQGRACLFGDVINGEMILNNAGRMVEKWYYELENKYPDKRCHAMIVMPNHFHCIIENVGFVGPDVGVRQNHGHRQRGVMSETGETGEHIGSPQRKGSPQQESSSNIPRAVQWFKTMTTNAYIRGVKQLGWTPFDGKLWQPNYYEHIIRNGPSYQRISEYIIDNPAKWQDDKFHRP